MTVYVRRSLHKIPYIHRIYILVLASLIRMLCVLHRTVTSTSAYLYALCATKASNKGQQQRPATKASNKDQQQRPATKTSNKDQLQRPATKASNKDQQQRPATKASNKDQQQRPATKTSYKDQQQRPVTSCLPPHTTTCLRTQLHASAHN